MLNNIFDKGFNRRRGETVVQAIGSIRTQSWGHKDINNCLYVQMADAETRCHLTSGSNFSDSQRKMFDGMTIRPFRHLYTLLSYPSEVVS